MVKFQFSYLQGGTETIKFYSSIKFTWSKPFCLYLIERTIGRGKANEAILEPK